MNGDGTHYPGDIAVRVRFATEEVDGLITNLETTEGKPWTYLCGDVVSIILPTEKLRSNWVFGESAVAANAMADATFALRAGSPGRRATPAALTGGCWG